MVRAPAPSHDKVVRIGGASGFWGDSRVGPRQLVRSGRIDYLVFDYLAETTMAILAAARGKHAELGYATDFVDVVMKAVLPDAMRQGIKVVANAGGINPHGCAEALRRVAESFGLAPRIAVVEGDDVSALLPALRQAGQRDMFTHRTLPEQVLSANAYLGALPIAAALAAGADIVVTGRCVDSAVTLGPLMHEFGWTATDYDALAGGSLAGHIIECGCQATGGLHTDWEQVPDWAGIGYPIVDCARDGSFTVSKPAGTGGLIARAAVAEQMLYEIGDPAAYVLPDVVCDFSNVRIEQLDAQHVRVSGARGSAPTDHYKVSSTVLDGYRCAGTTVIIGIDAAAKARRTAEAILARTRAIFRDEGLPDYTATRVEVIGAETMYGPHARAGAAREVMMRVVVDHPRKDALDIFAREIAPSGTSWSPGTTGPGGGRPSASPLVKQVAFLIDKQRLDVRFALEGRSHAVDIPRPGGTVPTGSGPEPAPWANTEESTVEVPLIELAWARSGDKGDLSNIGIVARRSEWLALLWRELTPEAVRTYFAHLVKGQVRRYWLPGIAGMNLVMEEALEGGGPASMRMDPLGKGMAQMLLDLPVRVPLSVAEALARARFTRGR
jgi:hypothetical protein